MSDRDSFIEMLRFLSENAKNSEKPLSKSEIAVYLKDMKLSDEQQELIYQYLRNFSGKADIENFAEEGCNADRITDRKDFDTADKSEWKYQNIIKLAEDKKKSGPETKFPESVFFQLYLKNLQKITPCTEQEEERLYGQLIKGEKTAVQRLSEQWMLHTFELAKKYAMHAEHLEDVFQEGNMAVFLTLNNMLGSGIQTDFRKMLKRAAEDAMQAYEADTAAAEKMDQSLLAKAALVYEAQKILAESLQRMPSLSELSQYTKLPETELEDILSILKEKK